jgi:hypothetical protein
MQHKSAIEFYVVEKFVTGVLGIYTKKDNQYGHFSKLII